MGSAIFHQEIQFFPWWFLPLLSSANSLPVGWLGYSWVHQIVCKSWIQFFLLLHVCTSKGHQCEAGDDCAFDVGLGVEHLGWRCRSPIGLLILPLTKYCWWANGCRCRSIWLTVSGFWVHRLRLVLPILHIRSQRIAVMRWWWVCQRGRLPAHICLWWLGVVLTMVASRAWWVHLHMSLQVQTFSWWLLLVGRVLWQMDADNSLSGGTWWFLLVKLLRTVEQTFKLIMIVLCIYELAIVFCHGQIRYAYFISGALPHDGLSWFPMLWHIEVYPVFLPVLLLVIVTW